MSTAASAEGAVPSATEIARLRRRAVLSCLVGNLFELYDFGVYGYFAASIGRAMFPSADPVASVLSSFATYGVGFLMRPVGALVIGSYGDRYGRKSALVVTVTLMATATGLTGLVPSYASIGIFAPILLVLCRLAQGFSTGGEWGGAASFMVEYAPGGQRGFYGSLQQVSTGLGQLLSISMTLILSSLLDQQALGTWGWRIPFIVGFLLAPVGYYLRSRVSESPVFERSVARRETLHAPVQTALTVHRKAVATAFGITVIWTAGTFIFLTFMLTFAQQQLHMDPKTASAAATLAAMVNVICLPIVGTLSDRFGRKPFLTASAAGFLLLAYPAFLLVVTERSFGALLAAQATGAFLYALINGSASAMLCELFPTHVRYSALSIGYNGAVMIFGGFAPFIATWLIKTTGALTAPSFYVMACAFVSLMVILRLKDRAHEPLA
ncbi:MAG TPA: MFS transporter [Stellaceae bacterium]|nr:MFS transporter [Stellaceae bacterium]